MSCAQPGCHREDDEPFVRSLYAIEIERGIDHEEKWTLMVHKYRTRKGVCLAITTPERPGVIESLAYFKTEEKAETFVRLLKLIVGDHG